MADQLQLRGGTTSEHSTFTGALREVTVDTDKDVLVVHDNSTAGGHPLMAEDGSNSALALGSAGTPSLKFTGDTNTGVFSPAADTVGVSTGGSERARIDSSGRLLVGTSTSRAVTSQSGTEAGLQIETTSYLGLSISSNTNDGGGSELSIGKSRGTAVGGTTIVQNNDVLGVISFNGADGTDLQTNAARIAAEVDGTPGANDMPGRLVFSTTADGAASPTERMRIDNSGRLLIGDTTSPNTGDLTSTKTLSVIDTTNGGTLQLRGQSPKLFFDSTSSGNGEIYLDGSNLAFFSGTPNTPGTERARIDSSGRLLVGLSSSSDAEKLIVQGTSTNANGAGMLRLQLGSTPAASTTDIGYVFFGDNAGNYGASIAAQSAAAWSSGSAHPTDLIFSTTAGGTASPQQRMRIYSGGNVYIGASSTIDGLGLQVYSNSSNPSTGTAYFKNDNTTADHPVAAFATATNSTATSNVLIKFGINSYNSGSGQINANGAAQCAFGSYSDERLKENITDLPSQWENIKNLRPVEFDYIESQGGEHQIGFIAQEFENVYPDAVGSSPMFVGTEEASDEERLTLTGWAKTEARLVKALQEAMERIETLEAKVAALEAS